LHGTIFRKYNARTGRFVNIGGTNRRNGKSTGTKSGRGNNYQENQGDKSEVTKKFSLCKPVEETKNLIAVHNISDEREIIFKIKLGGDEKVCICIKIIEVLEMKSKIIFENTNKNAVQKSNKEFENLIKKSIYLALLEKGMINQKQYEKCLEKIKD
jgi:hypothetical protein